MVLPELNRKQIIDALNIFDQNYRNNPSWLGWENRKTQKYTISYEGKLYPPKMIISLATGVPRHEFNGGQQSNNYLSKYGFQILNISNLCLKSATANNASVKQPEVINKLKKDRIINESFGRQDESSSSITRELYTLLFKLQRFDHTATSNDLPENGIYFFFEKGEIVNNQFERVVRVGTHNGINRFRGRIRQHYGNRNSLRGNKNCSVFRKHVGGALLRRDDPQDYRLFEWLDGNGKSYPEVEEEVSRYLRTNFNFCCIGIESKEERLSLEKGLIALLAQQPLGKPSDQWPGHYAKDQKIGRSGLWNTQQLDAIPLNRDQLERLKQLALL